MHAFFAFLAVAIEIYIVVMIAYALSSWFPASPGSGMARVVGFLRALCEPVLRPVRRLIPPVRIGNAALDLSVMIAIAVGLVALRIIR
jgi:YggT family protein